MNDRTDLKVTPELRFKQMLVVRDGKKVPMRILQQKWVSSDGSPVWRDVPMIRSRDVPVDARSSSVVM